MTQFDIRQTTNTNLKGGVTDFSVDAKQTDGPQDQKETTWEFTDFTKWYGYYSEIPELKKAIQVYATWVLGLGYEAENPEDKVELDIIKGWGEDTFLSIMWNMLVIKKVNGDSFAEIIRNKKKRLLNLKPLNPSRVQVVVTNKGVIKEYRYLGTKEGQAYTTFKPSEILHLVNDRVADNIHGDSVIAALQWLIDSRQEAMADWRRISHRSTIRVLIIDEDNPTKLTTYKTQYKEAIENGEVLIMPGKPGEKSFQDLQLPPVEAFLAWIRYLENAFYKAVGVPKTIAGDAEGIPESGGKMAMLTHEPTYNREVMDLEMDLLNQLGVTIKFNKQPSLQDNTQEQEGKNNNQTQAAQPSDTKAGGIK
jgi:hypothetical protein